MQNLDLDIDFSKEFKNIENKKAEKKESKESDENVILIEINDSDNNMQNYDKKEENEVDSIIITANENESPNTPFLNKINIEIKDENDLYEPEKE